MAAITFTPASVLRTNGPTATRIAGEALVQGAIYYIKASDQRAYNAVNTSAAAAAARGVALVAATAAGQPFVGQEGGELAVGSAVLTLGKAYAVSATAGKCIAVDELANPAFITGVGYPKTTSTLKLAFCASGAQVPA
jgi:hypothetical protein